MKKHISIIFASLLACSCVDTVILPDDKTVDEDFWQTKGDVSLIVNGAYHAMISNDVLSRLIVWGDFRSDELIRESSISNSDATAMALTEIEAGNISTTNAFSNWSSLYSVINYCNIVIEKSEAVMSIDPSYTEGDYHSDRSQMLALRALAHFYLVRTFRDIPYADKAFMNSSQELNLPQSAPDSVLTACLSDLEEAEKHAIAPDAYTNWRRTGWFNRDGIRALMADIYLWRGSVKHDAGDYQKCVDYCNLIIESKKNQHQAGQLNTEVTEYPLEDGLTAYQELFTRQNAEESILELQCDGRYNSNTGLCQMLYKYRNNTSTTGYVKASPTMSSNTVYPKYSNDLRYWQNVYNPVPGSPDMTDVRKMIATNNRTQLSAEKRDGSRAYNNFAQNYIIYRLSDIMLMKAEALTQLAADDKDISLRQAFNLVQAVYNRSLSNKGDSLTWGSTGYSKSAMEELVLQERLRELCFEGKRWYDLLRYNYRHVEGIDYSTTLFRQAEQGGQFVQNYKQMLNLMIRKYTSGGASVAAKLRTEPYLYMPILQSEMDVCPLLVQNPVYESSKQFEKNY